MEEQKDYLAIIMQAIAKLERLITEFLEFSRIEGKEYKPVLGPYNLEEALYRQIEMSKIAAEKKEIQIHFGYTQEDLPCCVCRWPNDRQGALESHRQRDKVHKFRGDGNTETHKQG